MGKSFFDDLLPGAQPSVIDQAIAPKRSGTRHTIGVIADVLATLGGAQPGYRTAIREQQAMERQSLLDKLTQARIESEMRPKPQAPHYWETNNGSLGMVDPATGLPKIVYDDPTPKIDWIQVKDPATGALSIVPRPQGAPTTPMKPVGKLTPIAPGGAGPGPRTFQPPAVMDSLIQQESGGRPGVLGPVTKYGQAQGLTQMLPATAQAVAKKLGVPWRADLMTGTDAGAASYQRALGQAYLEEGYQATGNIRDALHYYHGGPSRKLWGPKTRRYADTVISRLGGQ